VASDGAAGPWHRILSASRADSAIRLANIHNIALLTEAASALLRTSGERRWGRLDRARVRERTWRRRSVEGGCDEQEVDPAVDSSELVAELDDERR
jgi:hypothetical protein